MVVRVIDLADGCDTNAHGDALRAVLAGHLAKQAPVDISFADVPAVTSSYVNSAFVELLDDFSFDEIKRFVKISDANRQIANMIRDRMRSEIARSAAAV